MARDNDFSGPAGDGDNDVRRWAPYVALLAAVLGLAFYLYQQVTGAHGVKVEAPPPVVAQMLPPPPPPPPPPPQPQVKPPEPQENAAPVPNPEPAKAPDAPAPVTINGPAQAGSDSYGVQSGSGGGVGAPGGLGTCTGTTCGGSGLGGGISEAFYRRYLSSALQRRVQSDDRLNRQVFSADFAITIAGGRVTQATLVRSSGRSDRDEALRIALMSVSSLDPPPASIRFPQLVTVKGRRSL